MLIHGLDLGQEFVILESVERMSFVIPEFAERISGIHAYLRASTVDPGQWLRHFRDDEGSL